MENGELTIDNIKNPKIVPLILILIGVVARLIPHSPNVAPITAMALFGGAYLPKKYAIAIPLAAMLISDYFIGFHGTIIYVYGSFAAIGLMGLWLREKRSPGKILTLSLAASLLFYLVTNFGVWANPHSWYPHNLQGLMQSYIMGLPFLRNTIVGDVGYTALFFGGYELTKWWAGRRLPTRIYKLAFA